MIPQGPMIGEAILVVSTAPSRVHLQRRQGRTREIVGNHGSLIHVRVRDEDSDGGATETRNFDDFPAPDVIGTIEPINCNNDTQCLFCEWEQERKNRSRATMQEDHPVLVRPIESLNARWSTHKLTDKNEVHSTLRSTKHPEMYHKPNQKISMLSKYLHLHSVLR